MQAFPFQNVAMQKFLIQMQFHHSNVAKFADRTDFNRLIAANLQNGQMEETVDADEMEKSMHEQNINHLK